MNIIKSFKNKKDGLKYIEQIIRLLIQDSFYSLANEEYDENYISLLFYDFKEKACTIKAFNYYVESSYLYTNGFGTSVVVVIKHELFPQKYKISVMIRR